MAKTLGFSWEFDNMKKRIFIGSSIESKELAGMLQDAFKEEFECVLWYENFFSLGKHYYTDLVQKIITFDYAIMIGGEDDLVKRLSNQNEKISPRDNVYLEYGLFSGVLSPGKVLLLLHENCIAASDLSGMTILRYKNVETAVDNARQWINNMEYYTQGIGSISRKDIGLMPTVGIVVGYFYNFLKPFAHKVFESSVGTEPKLTVLVPSFVCDSVDIYKTILIKRLHLKENIVCNYRILETTLENGEHQMYDIPSTLLALYKTVNYVFELPEGDNNDTICAKMRALNDFYNNLQILVSSDYIVKNMVSVERLEE